MGRRVGELALCRRCLVDSLMLALRIGKNPRAVVTTTPRPTKLIKDLVGREGKDVVGTRGRTIENRGHLAPAFFSQITSQYSGTRLGRQELDGELLDDLPGATRMTTTDRLTASRSVWPGGFGSGLFCFLGPLAPIAGDQNRTSGSLRLSTSICMLEPFVRALSGMSASPAIQRRMVPGVDGLIRELFAHWAEHLSLVEGYTNSGDFGIRQITKGLPWGSASAGTIPPIQGIVNLGCSGGCNGLIVDPSGESCGMGVPGGGLTDPNGDSCCSGSPNWGSAS
jgi:hypothetical protein